MNEDIVDGEVLAEDPVEKQATEWVPDRAVTLAALAEIDQMQSGYPTCVVCGQRVMRLDRFGTCSKVSERSEPHRQHRNEFRAGARA